MSVEPTSRRSVGRLAKVGVAASMAGAVSLFGTAGSSGAVTVSFGVSLGVISLAGCSAEAHDRPDPGDQKPSGPPVERFAMEPGEAVRRTPNVLFRSGTSSTRTTMLVRRGDSEVTIHGHGRFDYARRHGWIEVTLPVTARTTQGPVTELVTPGLLYMRNRGPQVPSDKWVRVSTASLTDGNLVTGGATDPITAATLLRGARDVKVLGVKELRGVRVTHYRGVADMFRAAELAPMASGPALHAAHRSFTETVIPFDAYFDQRGRLRKVRQEFRFRSAGGDDVTVVSTTELYRFNAGKVDVALPKDADIYDGTIASPPVSDAAAR